MNPPTWSAHDVGGERRATDRYGLTLLSRPCSLIGVGAGADFWVHECVAGNLGTTIIGTLFEGLLNVGDVVARVVVDGAAREVELTVREISMFDVLLDHLDTGCSANILVTGQGAEAGQPHSHLHVD